MKLAASDCPSIVALRSAYDCLGSQLDRDDPELGAISGSVELKAILGEQVSGVGTLHLARVKPQRALTHAVQAAAERAWRDDADAADCTRLTDAGGPESVWVGQCPTRPEYVMTGCQWRDGVSTRLGVQKPRNACFDHLLSGQALH